MRFEATTAMSCLLLALGAGGMLSAQRDGADLVLRRGTLYTAAAAPTADGTGGVAGSVAIKGGALVYVGPDAGVERFVGPRTEVVELAGRAVTPGLIDAHSHLEGLGAALEEVDLRDVASFEEVVRKVAAAAAELPAGTWVRGRGWDQNLWPGKAFPTHGPLSAAIPDHPVWLTRVDGHATLVNAAAMRALGMGADIADPPGGRFERDEQGAPTGVLVDNAQDLVGGKLPPDSPDDRRRHILRAAHAAASVGLTTVTDMGIDAVSAAEYRKLQEAGQLPIRVAAFWSGGDSRIGQWLGKPYVSADRFFTLRGVKLYADGALGSRGAALLEPYADDAKNLGLLVTPGAVLESVAKQSIAAGYQVAIHAIGDRGNLVAIDALEGAFGGAPKPDARCRIEHVQIVRRDDLQRMARLGIIASMQPTHATSDMPWVPDRLGAARLDRAYPWRTALQLGAHLALGSDFPVERPEPLLGLYAAVSRQDLAGKPAGGWLPEQRLSRAEALAGFTKGAAWSLFLDDAVGTLEVGKRADLVVYGRDPMTVPAIEIPTAPIDLTIVDGKVVYRREGAP